MKNLLFQTSPRGSTFVRCGHHFSPFQHQIPLMRQMSPNLLDALRSTLTEIERKLDLSPDDPAVIGLRRTIMQRIAALELNRSEISSEPELERDEAEPAA